MVWWTAQIFTCLIHFFRHNSIWSMAYPIRPQNLQFIITVSNLCLGSDVNTTSDVSHVGHTCWYCSLYQTPIHCFLFLFHPLCHHFELPRNPVNALNICSLGPRIWQQWDPKTAGPQNLQFIINCKRSLSFL